MKRIYTRRGDSGTTGIRGGSRVAKDDLRIEANGTLDELNAVLGIVRSLLPPEHEWQAWLQNLQTDLMGVMSRVATPSDRRAENPHTLPTDLTARCEQQMDAMTAQLTDQDCFVLPGGTPVAAQLQFARTIARRAERRLCSLHRQDPVEEEVLAFVNRLSDLFFVMARWEMQQQGGKEERWRTFKCR
ncbi:MAG: cob(I)yrinic acid a,c-diamide adenosyltransferase [Bacteroides sp.]